MSDHRYVARLRDGLAANAIDELVTVYSDDLRQLLAERDDLHAAQRQVRALLDHRDHLREPWNQDPQGRWCVLTEDVRSALGDDKQQAMPCMGDHERWDCPWVIARLRPRPAGT